MSSLKATLFDMHAHVCFANDADTVLKDASEQGLFLLDSTVMPSQFEAAHKRAAIYGASVAGVGFHPWWVCDGSLNEGDLAYALNLIKQHPIVSEVGLDWSRICKEQAQTSPLDQVEAFTQICRQAVHLTQDGRPHLLSIHSSQAATQVLDILEATGCIDSCTCIFHWFSGTSQELMRAIDAGCWFSVGKRALQSKRWRSYSKTIPATRLLLETDLPGQPGDTIDAATYQKKLVETQELLNALVGYDLYEQMREQCAKLLSIYV